MVWDRI